MYTIIKSENMIQSILFFCLFFYLLKESLGKKQKMVLIGDSHGIRLYNRFKEHYRCRTNIAIDNAIDGRYPNTDYWSKNGEINGLIVHTRDCGVCLSQKSICHNEEIATIEYIAMEYSMDTEVSTIRTSWDKTCDGHPGDVWCQHSSTTQEFIFGEWFSKLNNTCPDIIYHLGSTIQDISRRTERGYRRNMIWMFDLIEDFLDTECTNSKYFFSTTPRVAESKVLLPYRNFTNNNIISRYNDISLSVFPRHPRMFKAIDIYNLSVTLDDNIYLDAFHLSKSIYDDIVHEFRDIIANIV